MGNGSIKAYAAVVLIRIMYSVMQVVSKVALDQGMNPLVFIFYRHTTAALVLIPIAFVLESLSCSRFNLRVTGCGDLFNLGLNYASATSSSALYNVQPVVTFIFAVIFGLESMKLKRFHGHVKSAGILFCIGGVIVLAFYEGPMFKSFNHHHLFQQGGSSSSSAGDTHYSKKQWALGIFLMTLSNVLGGLWNVFQGPLIEDTSKLMNTMIQISFASVQAFVVAVSAERDFSKWKLGWNFGLAAIIYSGVIVTALSYYMQIWTIAKRGPVFLAMSMPLTLIFTIIISSFILGDAVSLGSIVAGILLIGGLFNVLWGKNLEERDELNKIGGLYNVLWGKNIEEQDEVNGI
uniref:WAT1-related protein n=1 Tax=Oryza meridionalis TaxID=40149 RepID=A0A0E0ECB2_9ORYZ